MGQGDAPSNWGTRLNGDLINRRQYSSNPVWKSDDGISVSMGLSFWMKAYDCNGLSISDQYLKLPFMSKEIGAWASLADKIWSLVTPGTLGTLLFPSQKRQRPLKISPAVWSFQILTFAHKIFWYGIGDILLGRTSNLTATDFQRQKVVCQKVHTALLFKVCLEFSNAIVSKDLRV